MYRGGVLRGMINSSLFQWADAVFQKPSKHISIGWVSNRKGRRSRVHRVEAVRCLGLFSLLDGRGAAAVDVLATLRSAAVAEAPRVAAVAVAALSDVALLWCALLTWQGCAKAVCCPCPCLCQCTLFGRAYNLRRYGICLLIEVHRSAVCHLDRHLKQ